jgi:hypothetical protein
MVVDPHLNLEDAIDQMESLVDNYRDGFFEGYFTWNGYKWDCNEVGRLNIIGIIVMGMLNSMDLGPGFLFRTYDNQDVSMTGAGMAAMGQKMFQFLSTAYKAGWQHKANIQALTDPIAVQEYDYQSTLWPDPNV